MWSILILHYFLIGFNEIELDTSTGWKVSMRVAIIMLGLGLGIPTKFVTTPDQAEFDPPTPFLVRTFFS